VEAGVASSRVSDGKRIAGVSATLLVVLSCGGGCGSSPSDSDDSTQPPLSIDPARVIDEIRDKSQAVERPDIKPVQWRLSGVPSGRRIRVFSEHGYCAGETPPEFKGVSVTARGMKILITTYVQRAEPVGEICRGVGGFQHGIIELDQNVADLKLFDASASHPIQRWPREKDG
jgi:hypothetical protein